jgi:integrase
VKSPTELTQQGAWANVRDVWAAGRCLRGPRRLHGPVVWVPRTVSARSAVSVRARTAACIAGVPESAQLAGICAGKATGTPVKAHQFRHTAATGWARSGIEPDVLWYPDERFRIYFRED